MSIKLNRHDVLNIVKEEDDLDNEMPDEMWETISKDRDACMDAFRWVLRETKKNIIAEILKLEDVNKEKK